MSLDRSSKISQSPQIGGIPNKTGQFYEFGVFRLETAQKTLYRGDQPVSLTPKAFETLYVLVQNPGQVLEKDFLMRTLWPDSFVEESNLSQNIFTLRKTLGEREGGQQFIETIPRRGYRFVAPVVSSVPADTDTLILESRSKSHVVIQEGSPRYWMAARIGILAVILLAFAYYFESARQNKSSSQAGIAVRPSVAVLGFKNLTGHEDTAWISTALTEMLATELASGQRIRVIPGENVARAKMEFSLAESSTLSLDTLRRVRENLGSDYVVAGSYTLLTGQPQSRIRVDFRLQSATEGGTIASVSETGNEAELFQLASDAGRELRQKLGAGNLSLAEAATVRKSFSEDPKAARLYAEGVARLRVLDSIGARDLLSEAVAIDPGNAKAHSALAAAWSLLGYDVKALDAAKEAFAQATDLSREDQLSIEGRYRELGHEWPRAIEIYRTLWGFFPDNVDYALRLAKTQVTAGKAKDSLQVVADLRKLPSPLGEDVRIDLHEALANISTGDFQKAQASADASTRKARAMGARLLEAQALSYGARAWERLGQSAKSLQASEGSIALYKAAGDLRGEAYSLLYQGDVRYDSGNFKEAADSFENAHALFAKIGTQVGVGASLERIGNVYYEGGKLAEAKASYEQALMIQREIGDKRAIPGQLGNIANVLDDLGDLNGALKMHEQSLAAFQENDDQRGVASTLNNLGALHIELGDLEDAKRNFSESQAIDQKIGYRRGEAYGLTGSGEVQLRQNNLAAARSEYEKALTISRALGSDNQSAQIGVSLARLEMEDGQLAKAETLARASKAEFEKDRTDSDAAWADAVLARILLAQGKATEAANVAERAAALSLSSPGHANRFEGVLALSRVKGHLGQTAIALKELDSNIALAHRDRNMAYEFELRLARAEIDNELRDAVANRARLRDLEKEARARGFLLIAARAAKQLARSS